MRAETLAVLLSALSAFPASAAHLEDAAALKDAPAAEQPVLLQNFFDGSRLRGLLPAAGRTGPGSAMSQAQLKQMMLQNLDFVSMEFKSQYAPAVWKETHNGWDMDAEIAKAKAQIKASPNITLKEYQAILRRVITSTRDYHVSVGFASTEKASLPFQVAGSNGRYYIVAIDRTKLPESTFPFHEGDELVLFGGKKTADAVKAVQAGMVANVPGTDRALATYYLTLRSSGRLGSSPQGPITIAVRPKGTDKLLTHQLIWEYSPELIGSGGMKLAAFGVSAENRLGLPLAWLDDMLSPLAKDGPGAGPYGLGNRESFLPPLGLKLWESDASDTFQAYLYKGKGGKLIGYVRIPSYVPADANKAAADFAKVAAKFEQTADALVIDQLNNPGGSVFYLYALASMLSDQALSTPRHRIAITQEDVVEAAQFLSQAPAAVHNDEDARKVFGGPMVEGYPVSYEFYLHTLEFNRFIVDQWNKGNRLTDPVWLFGVDQINPSPAARFTKPVLLLVNELDFSGGDFFPAILQDNKRVTVFGTRTSGAGGFIRKVEFPNQLGISYFSMTGSIAERAGKEPIENLGVTADIQQKMTPADYQDGFKAYIAAVNAAVSRLAK